MVLVHLQPVVIVVVCHAIATDGGVGGVLDQTNKQKFKVRQPQRAARSKRPNTPSDGSKNNGIHTTKQEEYPSRHPSRHHGLCLDRSVALTLEGLIRPYPWWPHSMVVGSGCIYPSVVESFAWFLYISSPW